MIEKLENYQKVLEEFEQKLRKAEACEIDLNTLDPNNYEESLASAVAKARGPEYPELIKSLAGMLFDLFSEYAVAEQGIRYEIELLFNDKNHLTTYLSTFPAYSSEQFKKTGIVQWLRVGLIAALIEDGRTDSRDTWVGLGQLYCVAEKSGLEPFQYFREIGMLRSSETEQFDIAYSGSGILSDFLDSEYRKSLKCGKS